MRFGICFAAAGWAALTCLGSTSITQPGKGELTATQAVVRVTTDQAGFCKYRVSEGSSFTASVNDVNPSLFSGSDSDARLGSIITGEQHVFVAGTRTAAKASNGKFYSRALQANTVHWVGVTCGADAEVSTIFRTLNLPLGNSAPELMPFDSNAFGNVAVPSIDWRNKSIPYVDMMWGTQLHRASGPDDVGFLSAPAFCCAFKHAFSLNGHWANSSNALSAGPKALASCDTSATCTSADTLFLAAAITYDGTGYKHNGSWQPDVGFTDFLAQIWGSGSDGSPANRTVSVCWSIDSQTCFTSSKTVVLPQTTAAFAGTAPQSWSAQWPWSDFESLRLRNIVVASGTATVSFARSHGLNAGRQICVNGIRNQSVASGIGGNGLNGCHVIVATPTPTSLTFRTNAAAGTYTDSELLASTDFPQAQWASWGAAPPHNSVGLREGGTVTVRGGAVVLRGSGAPYSNLNPAWAGGTKIFIAGSSPTCNANLCTIASVRDATHLTILENLTISDASWSSADFGLLIRKITGTGAVSVSAGYQFAYSSMYNSGLDGSGDICNSNPVTVRVDAAGDPISASQQGYLCVMNATALSQILTPIYLFIPATGETRLLARNYQTSTNDYTHWVGWHPTDGASWFTHRFGTSYFKTTYLGDFRALTPGYIQNNVESATPEQLSFSDVFAGPGNDVISQIVNCRMNVLCDSAINSAVFNLPPSPPQTGAAIRGSYMVLCGNTGAQDSPGYVTYWDIGKIPARLTWAAYTWDRYPVGYGGIHGCQSFGTGRFNLISLNAQLGQVGGNEMTGPWQATPIMVDATGTGYVSNTLIKPADGFYCPAGLDAKWQEIGAAPRAQGGLPLCVKIRIPGEPCSRHASAVESANFPCPWNSTANFSMLKGVGEGDTIHDARYGFVTYGENMLVVKKVVNSTRDIELTVFRYRLSPRANYACGSATDAEMTHLSGWTMQMAPFESCAGGNYWTDALDPAHRWFTETLQISGVHSDFGPGSSGYSFIGGAQSERYHTRANQPMPQQIGRLPTARISANPKFGSTQLPDTFLQTYPSKRQQFAPIPEMDWALDIRHYNPPVGNPPETTEGLFGNTLTRVSGASNTYRITFPGNQTPDLKHTGFVGWAGWHQLADKSGPASSLGDSDSWHYCFAYKAGECVRGSPAGEMYVSVPQAETSVPCQVNSYSANAPCISNNYPYGFWVLQFDASQDDPNGLSSRRLASMFVAPGRQYNFTNAKPTPDGKWAIAQAEWLEGQRTDMYWIKLPPFPPRASFPDASGTPPLKLQITGAPGDSIRIAFGYAENGNPSDFYCTTRKEACYTSATATPANPFVFAGEAQSYTACSSTCTITIPAIRGRVLYYRVEPSKRSKSFASAPRVVAVE